MRISKLVRESFEEPADNLFRIRLDDGIVCGLSLISQSLLVTLVFRTRDDNNKPVLDNDVDSPQKGRSRRQNGLPPDVQVINLENADEPPELESLTVSRHENLTMTDYHLSCIYVPRATQSQPIQKGTFEVLGGGIWDARISASRMFSSGASIFSSSSSGDKVSVSTPRPSAPRNKDVVAAWALHGLKIFIQSPYDCIMAYSRDQSDHVKWLIDHERYEEAWHIINQDPQSIIPDTRSESRPSTPSKAADSLRDFLGDDTASETGASLVTAQNSAVEKEKLRIGALWLQELVDKDEWSQAAEVASKVLGTSSRWEHWIWTFVQKKKFDEITPQIPHRLLKPPIPSITYEVIIGHYISSDIAKLKGLLDEWDTALYDLPSVISAIESKLGIDERELRPEGDEDIHDWNILNQILAKLYLADARPKAALQCYIRLKNLDAAFELIQDYQLSTAVADQVYDFVTVGIPQAQVGTLSIDELAQLSADPIQLLASAVVQGLIPIGDIVKQLEAEAPASNPFLFFFFRALWQGDAAKTDDSQEARIDVRHGDVRRSRFDTKATAQSAGRLVLAPFGNSIIDLFAEYARVLLTDYLKHSQHYSFDYATSVCEKRHYIPELVHLRAATGQSISALHLIIDELDDVPMAINFAKDMDDPGLWDELMHYSMDKPTFIKGLLDDGGTSLDPVKLVKTIPDGLAIEGLKEGLSRLLRESEILASISEGAAQVLRSEISAVMEKLKAGRRRGVLFDVDENNASLAMPMDNPRSDTCEVCKLPWMVNIPGSTEQQDRLIGFPCNHIYHLACILKSVSTETNQEAIANLETRLADVDQDRVGEHADIGRVGSKIVRAQMIKHVLGSHICPVCDAKNVAPNDSAFSTI